MNADWMTAFLLLGLAWAIVEWGIAAHPHGGQR